jgi:DNA polymerase-3 subunit chi
VASIHFYHLTSSPLEKALPKVLERCYAGGFRTVVLVKSTEQAERLNDLLWTYDAASFLPHSMDASDASAILLATQAPAPGEKEILFITSGTLADDPAAYERVIDMFDGTDPESLSAARNRWKHYKDAGHEMVYNRQAETGGWVKAA